MRQKQQNVAKKAGKTFQNNKLVPKTTEFHLGRFIFISSLGLRTSGIYEQGKAYSVTNSQNEQKYNSTVFIVDEKLNSEYHSQLIANCDFIGNNF
ncbi:MAG: hypothetical protein HXX16_10830 [Bacteroidales bacterium]|nr:hypothetical protein [Bacteroidales bacterium]